MIEFKLKAKNCKRGQLFRSAWVSSTRCSSNKLEQRDWEPIVYYYETQIQMFADWSMSYGKPVTLTYAKIQNIIRCRDKKISVPPFRCHSFNAHE